MVDQVMLGVFVFWAGTTLRTWKVKCFQEQRLKNYKRFNNFIFTNEQCLYLADLPDIHNNNKTTNPED